MTLGLFCISLRSHVVYTYAYKEEEVGTGQSEDKRSTIVMSDHNLLPTEHGTCV